MESRNGLLDREMAIQELTKGHDLMTQLQSLLQGSIWDVERAGDLSKGVLQAFEVGLSVLKSIDITPTELYDPVADSAADSACSIPQRNEGLTSKRVKRLAPTDHNQSDQSRRGNLNSNTVVTYSPFDDGYQWRKYGQKVIHNVRHPRNYYRCTHRECSARKLVQQKDSGDPPKYEVICINEHTCNTNVRRIPQLMLPCPPRGALIVSFNSNVLSHGSTNDIEQEQQPFLSPFTQPNLNSSGEMFSPRSTDTCCSSVNPTLPDPTAFGSTGQEFLKTTPDNNNCRDSASDICSSPEGPWFGRDALTYTGILEPFDPNVPFH